MIRLNPARDVPPIGCQKFLIAQMSGSGLKRIWKKIANNASTFVKRNMKCVLPKRTSHFLLRGRFMPEMGVSTSIITRRVKYKKTSEE